MRSIHNIHLSIGSAGTIDDWQNDHLEENNPQDSIYIEEAQGAHVQVPRVTQPNIRHELNPRHIGPKG